MNRGALWNLQRDNSCAGHPYCIRMYFCDPKPACIPPPFVFTGTPSTSFGTLERVMRALAFIAALGAAHVGIASGEGLEVHTETTYVELTMIMRQQLCRSG